MPRLIMTHGQRWTASLLAVLLLFTPVLVAAIDAPQGFGGQVGVTEGDVGSLGLGAPGPTSPTGPTGAPGTASGAISNAVEGSLGGGFLEGLNNDNSPVSPAVNAARGLSFVTALLGIAVTAAAAKATVPVAILGLAVLGINALCSCNLANVPVLGPVLGFFGNLVTEAGRALGNLFSGKGKADDYDDETEPVAPEAAVPGHINADPEMGDTVAPEGIPSDPGATPADGIGTTGGSGGTGGVGGGSGDE